MPASKAKDLRRSGVVIEAVDENDERPHQTLAVTISDLPGAVRRYADAGLVRVPEGIDVDAVVQYSLDVLERCLAGESTVLEEI